MVVHRYKLPFFKDNLRHFLEDNTLFLTIYSLVMIQNLAGPNIHCLSRAFCPFRNILKKLFSAILYRRFDLINLICWSSAYFVRLSTHGTWWNTMLDLFISVCHYFFPIEEALREKFKDWLSAILHRHFDLLNAIFMKANIFFQTQHILIMIKNHAGPNNNYLPLNVFLELFLEIRTRLNHQTRFVDGPN